MITKSTRYCLIPQRLMVGLQLLLFPHFTICRVKGSYCYGYNQIRNKIDISNLDDEAFVNNSTYKEGPDGTQHGGIEII